MPIRSEERARYPKEWPKISAAIRERAGDRCECMGECGRDHQGGRCNALNHAPHPATGSIVVLAVAHLDHTPENVDPGNLKAMCQRCHLAYDFEHHEQTKRGRLPRIATLEDMDGWSIQVATLTEMLGLTRSTYNSLVQAGIIDRGGGKWPLLVPTINKYVSHLRRTEGLAQANLERLQAQTEYYRQRQVNEALKTSRQAGELIPAAEYEILVDDFAGIVKRFLDDAIAVMVRQAAPKKRINDSVKPLLNSDFN